jgi:hypothetical protein
MPSKQASLSVEALLGNLEVVCLPGLLREKYFWVPLLDPEVIKILSMSEALTTLGHTYLGSFFLNPEDIRKINIGVIWNFGRNRAPLI